MRIKNTINMQEYDVTPQEWAVIQSNGNEYKYEIINDGAPIEVRSMRASQVKSSLPEKKAEHSSDAVEVKITKKTKKQS